MVTTVVVVVVVVSSNAVVGSAVMAFEQVCPERTDLIHKNYRKLCSVLVDIEEWGQIIIVGMLTRYARTQFTDPNAGAGQPQSDKPKCVPRRRSLSSISFFFFSKRDSPFCNADGRPFYEESDAEDEQEDGSDDAGGPPAPPPLDADHRMLLRNTKPLLQSRNASVIIAVAQLYHHLAPRDEVL